MSNIGVAEIKNQQLLDNSSDYNNFENLSYFIGEYKKAKEIISQCKSFYKNFLRTKLYTISDLKRIPNVNFIDLHLCLQYYKENTAELAKYLILSIAQEEIRKISDDYDLKFFAEYTSTTGHQWDNKKNIWILYPKKNSLFYASRLFSFLTRCLLDDESLISNHPTENTYIYDNYVYDSFVNEDYVKENKLSSVKYVLEKKKYGEDTYKSCFDNKHKPIYIDCFELGESEVNLIKFIEEFRKEHNYESLQRDIFLNPGKYYDKWLEFIEFRNKNYKFDEDSANAILDWERHRKICKELEVRNSCKNMICPAAYLKFTPNYRKRNSWERDTNEYYVIEENRYIEAYQYLNKKLLKLYVDYLKDEDNEYNDTYEPKTYKYNEDDDKIYISNIVGLFDSDLASYILLDIGSLLDDIKSISEYTEIDFEKYYFDKLDNEFYFTLINCTPFKFTDNLSKVKINYNEHSNILECIYDKQTSYKRWAWPSDSPYTVNEYHYKLEFDCSNNEPINYSYHHSTYEESKKDRRY